MSMDFDDNTHANDSRAVPPSSFSAFENAMFIVHLILSTVGILGNVLVCVTIARAKFMHNATNFLIAHLAIADGLVCASMVIFQERYVYVYGFLGNENTVHEEMICKLFFGHTVA